jgi:integrase
MEQKGYIFKVGGWWWLKYRDNVIDTDPQSPTFNRVVRKQLVRKLEPVQKEHQRLKNAPDEVQRTAKAFLAPLNNNQVTPESTMTVGQFVETVFLPHTEQQHHASTRLSDRVRWEKHLKARCADIRLRDFRTVTGSQIIADIARQNDLSRETLKRLKSFLSGVFKHAKNQGFFDGVNPITDVEIPKVRRGKPTHAYSREEINDMLALLDAAGEERAATIVAVAAFSGLRRSEIQGLLWKNYTGSGNGEAQLQVERSVWEGVVDETKTDSSAAPVPVISELAARLNKYRASLSVVAEVKPDGSMFAARNEKPVRLNNVLRGVIMPMLNRCIVCGKAEADGHKDHEFKRDDSRPRWRGWHAFRRGLATRLHDMGKDDHTIKMILRHSSVQVTQQSYIKGLPQQARDAMADLDAEQVELVYKRDKISAKNGKQLVN